MFLFDHQAPALGSESGIPPAQRRRATMQNSVNAPPCNALHNTPSFVWAEDAPCYIHIVRSVIKTQQRNNADGNRIHAI